VVVVILLTIIHPWNDFSSSILCCIYLHNLWKYFLVFPRIKWVGPFKPSNWMKLFVFIKLSFFFSSSRSWTIIRIHWKRIAPISVHWDHQILFVHPSLLEILCYVIGFQLLSGSYWHYSNFEEHRQISMEKTCHKTCIV
jgi:hypothetical protein